VKQYPKLPRPPAPKETFAAVSKKITALCSIGYTLSGFKQVLQHLYLLMKDLPLLLKHLYLLLKDLPLLLKDIYVLLKEQPLLMRQLFLLMKE
jgi:hypothetical protein